MYQHPTLGIGQYIIPENTPEYSFHKDQELLPETIEFLEEVSDEFIPPLNNRGPGGIEGYLSDWMEGEGYSSLCQQDGCVRGALLYWHEPDISKIQVLAIDPTIRKSAMTTDKPVSPKLFHQMYENDEFLWMDGRGLYGKVRDGNTQCINLCKSLGAEEITDPVLRARLFFGSKKVEAWPEIHKNLTLPYTWFKFGAQKTFDNATRMLN